jgi:hypothetical protein
LIAKGLVLAAQLCRIATATTGALPTCTPLAALPAPLHAGMRLLFERVRRDVRQLAAAGQRGVGSTFPCPCGCGQTQTKEPPTGCAWEVVYCICELMDDVGARGASLATRGDLSLRFGSLDLSREYPVS